MQSSRNPALREGLTFGVILGIILVINGAITITTGVGIGGIVTIVLGLAFFIWAGVRASAKTGKVSTGLLAGLWTGLFSSLIDFVGYLILTIIFINTVVQHAQQAAQQFGIAGTSVSKINNNTEIVGTVVTLIVELVVAVIIGLAFGAIGGAIGKGRAPAPQVPYQEAMYQGMPVPGTGYPQYPQAGTAPQYPPQAPQYPPQSPPQYPQDPQQ